MDKLIQSDPLLWAYYHKLFINDGVPFNLKDYPYLFDLVRNKKRVFNCKKGSQVCLTTTKFIEAIHNCYYRRYQKNIMYMMPTLTQVETLAKISFNPLFQFNPWLAKLTSNNSATLKTINGRSIYFVGSQADKIAGSQTKGSVNLCSVPCDEVDRDEYDLMDGDMIDKSKERMNASKFMIENNWSTPTYPGHGIDAKYEESDQSLWQIKCESCGGYTCLETDFPKCMALKDGNWIRSCVKCGKQIDQRNGSWQMAYPDREETGVWISNFLSPQCNLNVQMQRFHSISGGALIEYNRSTRGLACMAAEDGLTVTEVLANCGNDGIRGSYDGETCMGIDNNAGLRVVIGIRIGKDQYEVLSVRVCENLQEVHDYAAKFNVKYCVIDSGPADHGVKEFQRSEKFKTWLCYYNEQTAGPPKWNNKVGMVRVNRNEWCDLTHDTIIENKIILPRRSPEIMDFALELTHTVKAHITNPDTGLKRPRWIKSGGRDDFYHGLLYFLLRQAGLLRAGVVQEL